MAYAEYVDFVVRNPKHNAMRWTTTQSKEKMSDALRIEVGLWRKWAELRILRQRIDLMNNTSNPAGGLLSGPIVAPPLERQLNVLLGGFGDPYFEHCEFRSDSVLLAKLSFKVGEVSYSARV